MQNCFTGTGSVQTISRVSSQPVMSVNRARSAQTAGCGHTESHQHLCSVAYTDCFVLVFCAVDVCIVLVITLCILDRISTMDCQIKFKFGMWM